MLEIYAGHTGLDGGQKPKNDQFLYSGFIICIKQERKKQLSRSENEKLKMTWLSSIFLFIQCQSQQIYSEPLYLSWICESS